MTTRIRLASDRFQNNFGVCVAAQGSLTLPGNASFILMIDKMDDIDRNTDHAFSQPTRPLPQPVLAEGSRVRGANLLAGSRRFSP